MKQYAYCPYCSVALVAREFDGHFRQACPGECGFVHWNNPIPVAATVVARRHKIALVKRGRDPKRGFWCLPCGFVNEQESVKDGAERETGEETKLSATVDALPFHLAKPPGVNEHISFFRARSYSGTLEAGDDAEDAGWFSADDLPPIAFSTHSEVIAIWFKRPEVRFWRVVARLCAGVGIAI